MLFFHSLREVSLYLTSKSSIPASTTRMFQQYKVSPQYEVFLLSSPRHARYLRVEELYVTKRRPIGAIDVSVDAEEASIDWWMVNDRAYHARTGGLYRALYDHESEEMTRSLLSYAEEFAREHGCKRLRCDVHHSLREFNASLKPNGFTLSDEPAEDNAAWIKTYKGIR
jgi:hypothetical protein